MGQKEIQREGKRFRRKRGQIYFLILGYAESFHGGEVKYAQDGTYCFTELPTPYRTTRHNRQVVFAVAEDYQRYLTDLRELKDAFGLKVYAYCLMTNHVHLLLAPGESVAGLGQLMKALAARATRYRNRLEGRSGTLWESRYKSSVVQSDSYSLACSRYIELNPVRARMVADAADYPWSSYRIRVGEVPDGRWLDADPCFVALGNTAAERCRRYEAFVRQAVPADEIRLIRDALQRGQLTGTSRFVDEVERIVGVRIEQRGQGRPSGNLGK